MPRTHWKVVRTPKGYAYHTLRTPWPKWYSWCRLNEPNSYSLNILSLKAYFSLWAPLKYVTGALTTTPILSSWRYSTKWAIFVACRPMPNTAQDVGRLYVISTMWIHISHQWSEATQAWVMYFHSHHSVVPQLQVLSEIVSLNSVVAGLGLLQLQLFFIVSNSQLSVFQSF